MICNCSVSWLKYYYYIIKLMVKGYIQVCFGYLQLNCKQYKIYVHLFLLFMFFLVFS